MTLYVTTKRGRKYISFEAANGGGRCLFATSDLEVAQKVSEHSLVKTGRIIVAPEAIEKLKQIKASGKNSMEGEHPGPKTETETGEEKIKVRNFSEAKGYMKKTYGLKDKDVNTPEILAAKADEYGVKFEYVEEL